MKKVICILMAATMCLAMAACGEQQKATNVSSAAQIPSSEVSTAASSKVEEKAPAQKITDAKSVVDALKEKGLPIDNIIVYTAETDTNSLLGRPNQYTSKVNFADTRVKQYDSSDPKGGTVEVFNNESDAKSRYDYVNAIVQKGGSMFAQYLYLTGNVLLRIDGSLTPERAAEYQNAFNEIMK
jgi:hypothetical protein